MTEFEEVAAVTERVYAIFERAQTDTMFMQAQELEINNRYFDPAARLLDAVARRHLHSSWEYTILEIIGGPPQLAILGRMRGGAA